MARAELGPPTDRYVEMIEEASRQMTDLLDQLATVARIEAGRFDPPIAEIDSLALAREAAAVFEEGRVEVAGEGAVVRVPEQEMRRAVSQLARAASRHGGFDSVLIDVDGGTMTISPVSRSSGPVLLGEELRDLGAAAAAILVRALGGSVDVDGDRLVVRLPA
jgi:signal transduction histidine kinase